MAAAPPPINPSSEASKDATTPAVKVAGGAVKKVTSAPAGGPQDPSLANLLPAEGGPPVEGEEQENPHAPPPGFFNQPWVQNVLPLATSLGLHVGIILVGILGYQVAKEISHPTKDQVIIPEAKSMEKNAIPGGIPHPGLNNDATRDAAQDAIKNSANDGFTANISSNIAAAAGGQGDTDASMASGASASTGKGASPFSGGGGGGTAPWGVPGGGGGLLPKSNFMGTGGNATDIVYLCDASGSMLSVFGNLKQQLKESINALDLPAGQKFNVIFFSDANVYPLFKGGMQIATPDNKKAAMDFIDNQVSTGGTQPIPAIKEALAEKPQLLYVLTDGFDQIANFDDVTNAFKAGNADGKMHINCIFLQSDEDPKLEQVLKSIATQGHGDFKKILKSDM